jgi:dTDP-glucose pyrophosphorylase
MVDVNSLLIIRNASLKEAMKQMNDAGEKILLVVDEEKKFLGSLTDGDIRRWVLKEGSLQSSIDQICNKDPIFAGEDYTNEEIRRLMLRNRIEWIPVVDRHNEIADVLLWKDLFEESVMALKDKLNIPVVIMAGGKGTRLDPFTKILPKPLIPIGKKAIIDIIMDKFSVYGINEFYISINHKAKMIKSYFEGIDTHYNIHYIEENQPLGTAGSLKFLQGRIKDSLIVSNCDIIVDCDYNELVAFHNRNGDDISIVGSFRHFTIPYGICEIENGGILTSITEKPEYDFLVNTGMSILNGKVLSLIPENQKFHFTDLIEAVRNNGGKVGVFPISEKSWIDVGQWEEYRNSVRLLGFE